MAGTVDLDDYLHGENGVESGFRDLAATKTWADSEAPYRVVVRFYPPGSSGYSKAAEFKIASKAVFDVITVVSEIEKQVTESVGVSPLGRFHLLFSDAGGVIFQRQRQIAPSGDDGRNLSVDMLRSQLSEERARNASLSTALQGSYVAAQGTISAQGQTIAALATQRSVSSSAADAGGIHGLMGMAALLFAYPMLKKAVGLPENATAEQTVRAVQIAVERWGSSEKRQLATETPGSDAMPTLPEGAGEVSVVVPDAGSTSEIDSIVLRIKNDPDFRAKLLSTALADDDIKNEAISAVLGG